MKGFDLAIWQARAAASGKLDLLLAPVQPQPVLVDKRTWEWPRATVAHTPRSQHSKASWANGFVDVGRLMARFCPWSHRPFSVNRGQRESPTGADLALREPFWQAARYPSTMPWGEASSLKDNWGGLYHFAADGDPRNTPNRIYPEGLLNGAIAAPDPYASWHRRPRAQLPLDKVRFHATVTRIGCRRLFTITAQEARQCGVRFTDPLALGTDDVSTLMKLWEQQKKWPEAASNPWVYVIQVTVSPAVR